MAIVKVKIETEGYLGKFEAYQALCEDVGLDMLANGTERNYMVEDGVLYHSYDKSYHGSSEEEMEVYSKDPAKVLLFENLLAIKCLL